MVELVLEIVVLLLGVLSWGFLLTAFLTTAVEVGLKMCCPDVELALLFFSGIALIGLLLSMLGSVPASAVGIVLALLVLAGALKD